jgi:hypothetical protein
MESPKPPPPPHDQIPSSLVHPSAAIFWPAILLTGVVTGIGAMALTRLLELFKSADGQ